VSALLAALLAEASDDDLACLAEALAPYLRVLTKPAQDGWVRGAEKIAAYIDAPPSRVYALSSAGRIPVEHDGSNLIARKSVLDNWMCAGGGRRP
jgi:hypothetical protein